MLQTHMYSLLLISLPQMQTTNSFLSLITLKWPKEKRCDEQATSRVMVVLVWVRRARG